MSSLAHNNNKLKNAKKTISQGNIKPAIIAYNNDFLISSTKFTHFSPALLLRP